MTPKQSKQEDDLARRQKEGLTGRMPSRKKAFKEEGLPGRRNITSLEADITKRRPYKKTERRPYWKMALAGIANQS